MGPYHRMLVLIPLGRILNFGVACDVARFDKTGDFG